MFCVDVVEWERFGYREGLSRKEVETMSLREYLLRRQASLKDTIQTIRLETLPVVNALSEDRITVSDFFEQGGPQEPQDSEQVKAFRNTVAARTDLVDDWSLVDEDLDAPPQPPDQDNADEELRS